MIFTIEWMEEKITSTGKVKKDARLKGTDNVLVENVSIWQDFPGFAGLMNGGQVEGDLVPAKDPKYGPTLYPPRAPKTGGGAFKSAQMKEAQDIKRQDISKAQDTKSEHIRIAAAQRDAVLLVVNLYRERLSSDPILSEMELDKVIKDKILYYRDWFLSHEFEEKIPF